MTVASPAPSASRPEVPRFLVLRAARGGHPSTPALLESIRVRVVPDPTLRTPQRWPSFDGLALFDRRSGALTHLFVADPTTGAFLEWRLPSPAPAVAPGPSNRSEA